MKVLDHISEFQKSDYSVVTIGTFDGVHIGHQTILKRVVEDARKNGGESTLITFWPHPRFILKKDPNSLKLLSTFEEKVELVSQLGIDNILKIAFTPDFSNLSADQFVQTILQDGVATKQLYIGYDHHFGNNREGDIDFLKANSDRYGFTVNEISKQEIDHVGVSSTKIREALKSGEIHLANSLLGREYTLSGSVVDGQKKGRSIGYPTANIRVEESYKLLPADGVYAIKASVKGIDASGMLNVGFKPTVNGKERTIEAHLFEFNSDIYGEDITIKFVRSIRKEMKFDDLSQLQKQLDKDKEKAIELLL